ncbi:hypothetical protein NEIMUCOT_04691 [Neisseria mucosa ATCC 25996]|uniref:Uncharacterized protein n=1 Tax=Neisseria mucosa (strain ATCC 25996 / DSM 4631 / NCTC 10774 / M26) TaxID=546266 RepID=D2ZVP8_NEIM2|nr:hypothetical protein NEIMUCOT_04691 [Neisseria mucosa ATCC 25996]
MLAVVAFVFGNTAGEHTDAAAAQVAGAVLLDRGVDEGIHQRNGQAVAVAGIGLDVGEQFQTTYGLLEPFEQVGDFDGRA